MDVKGKLKSFYDNSGFKEKLIGAANKLTVHKNKIDMGWSIASTCVDYAKHKNIPTLIKGGFDLVRVAAQHHSCASGSFFSEANGWIPIVFETSNLGPIFAEVLQQYKAKPIAMNDTRVTGRIYNLSCGDVGYYTDSYYKKEYIYCSKSADIEQITNFLVNEKLKTLNTNFLSCNATSNWSGDSFELYCEDIRNIPSKRCDEFCEYMKNCIEKKINRALIFYGPPGTGKTTLSQSIVHQMGFKTLKFRYQTGINFHTLKFVINVFKIDAVIIDDFDQVSDSEQMLEFLEMLKEKTKLVIGLVNSLKKFHPAILRPGRFDQIVKVNFLEEQVIKELLGNLFTEYGIKVKYWPVAFINEFMIRHRLGSKELDKDYAELHERVKKQIEILSDGAETIPGEEIKSVATVSATPTTTLEIISTPTMIKKSKSKKDTSSVN